MQRSLSKLREEGWFCEITEHFVPWPAPGHRKDLFGFSDIIAVRGNEVLLVQTTTGSNAAARVAKIMELPAAGFWFMSPNRLIHVHAWRKVGNPKRWECRVVPVTLGE